MLTNQFPPSLDLQYLARNQRQQTRTYAQSETQYRFFSGVQNKNPVEYAQAANSAYRPSTGITPHLNKIKNLYGEKILKQLGITPCETCENRIYVDESNDPNVSFKSPGHIDPQDSLSAVSSHEQEHVTNAQRNADMNDQTVITQVQLHNALCPECGRPYVSGGKTTSITITSNKATSPLYQFVPLEDLKGAYLDLRI